MNVTKSKAFLAGVLLCLFAITLTAGSVDSSDEIESKRELIIVNLDEELNTQVVSLVKYVTNIFQANEGGKITIKTYVHTGDNLDAIRNLVVLLKESGIEDEDITMIDEVSNTNHSYFTMSVSQPSAIQ